MLHQVRLPARILLCNVLVSTLWVFDLRCVRVGALVCPCGESALQRLCFGMCCSNSAVVQVVLVVGAAAAASPISCYPVKCASISLHGVKAFLFVVP